MRLSYISAQIIVLYNVNTFTNASTKINLNERRCYIPVGAANDYCRPEDYLENSESRSVRNARTAERLLFRHVLSETRTYFPTAAS